jgi:hypothetical protein
MSEGQTFKFHFINKEMPATEDNRVLEVERPKVSSYQFYMPHNFASVLKLVSKEVDLWQVHP